MVERGGFWIDMNDPYITCTNEYIESVWWILRKFWDAGLLYEGHKVIPYCCRCGTALSSHEVAQGYDEVEDPSVFVRFHLKNEAKTSFLVWTTTPWTLLSNVALAVGAEIDYARVQVGDETLIMAKDLVEKVIGDKGQITGTVKGKDLAGTEYDQLFKYVKPEKKAHYEILADFVSTEDGSGIVHIAPAFGEDDYQAGRKHDLPVMQPVNLQGKFTDVIEPWKGQFVKDADPAIIDELKRRGDLWQAGKYKHTYPFCWRCDSPLLYYARHSWFIRATAIKDQVMANNEKINWHPDHVKVGRFKNFLENMVDWALSRDRYWGTPLPIWTCKCGYKHCIGSIEELKTMGKDVPANIEPHKPYVDNIEVACPKCSAMMKRVPEVIDCWFDSGAMHTAQWHYPFANQDKFKKSFPGDFICEAIDQTRGWFYSLLVTSTFLHQASAYKNVLVLGLICDKNGVKMSKSKGNVLDCMELFKKYGADAVRWSLYSGTAPWNTRRFYEEAIQDCINRFLGTLQNLHSFFVLYANAENFDPAKHHLPLAERDEIDRWILSRYAHTVAAVRESLDTYEVFHATQALETLVDEISNWYVRRSRRRFWANGMPVEQRAAFSTLYELLVGMAKLIAPFVPFIAEDLYQNLVRSIDAKAPESVHLCDYPALAPQMIDEKLEQRMGLVRDVVGLGRAARSGANVKVRQPLPRLLVKLEDPALKAVFADLAPLIKDELNVKEVVAVADLDETTSVQVKPNFAKLGAKYKKLLPKIKEHLAGIDGRVVSAAMNGEAKAYVTKIDDQDVSLTADEVEVKVAPREGWATQQERDLAVALELKLDPPLILEGLAREMVNKVQNMRKDSGLDISDRIRIAFDVTGSPRAAELTEALKTHGQYVAEETLAVTLEAQTNLADATEWDLNGIKTRIRIAKEASQ